MIEIPVKFEDEYPEVAAFFVRVFHGGGRFHQPKVGGRLIVLPEIPPVRGMNPYAECPRGSTKKVKFCHKAWTAAK